MIWRDLKQTMGRLRFAEEEVIAPDGTIPAMDGVLNVDKPPGASSARIVSRIKWLIERKARVGHAGTLDPFATGVLVVLVGKATRSSEWFMGQPKQYEATIKLGATTPTLDPDSQVIVTPGAAPVERPALDRALAGLVGEIEQVPPAYSAIKIAGRPAYRIARGGAEPELKPRRVMVYGVELIEYAWPEVRVRIDCGRGTYIRAIARDMGAALNAGGYLTELRRTRVGPCRIEEAATLEQIQEQGVERFLRPTPQAV